MTKLVARFVKDESGATAIEYGLVAAMMGIAVVAIFGVFKTKLETAFGTLGDALDKKAGAIAP